MMKISRFAQAVLGTTILFAVGGCETLFFKKQISAQKVRIQGLTVTGQYPPGSDHFEAWAMITGYQSSSDAKLLPPRQWLDGYRVHLEQLEQPIGDASDQRSPFSRSLPIDTSELPPGFYIVNVNGSEKRLEIPDPPVEEAARDAPGEVLDTQRTAPPR